MFCIYKSIRANLLRADEKIFPQNFLFLYLQVNWPLFRMDMDYNLLTYILVFHRILDFKNKGPISIGPFFIHHSEFEAIFFHYLVYIFLL